MISKVNNLFECVLCCFLYALLGKKMPVKKKKKSLLLCNFAYVALSYFSETQGVTSH